MTYCPRTKTCTSDCGGGAGGGGGDGGGGAIVVRHTAFHLANVWVAVQDGASDNRHVFPETTKPLQVVSGGGGDGSGMGAGGGEGGIDSNPNVSSQSRMYSVYARFGNSRASVA